MRKFLQRHLQHIKNPINKYKTNYACLLLVSATGYLLHN